MFSSVSSIGASSKNFFFGYVWVCDSWVQFAILYSIINAFRSKPTQSANPAAAGGKKKKRRNKKKKPVAKQSFETDPDDDDSDEDDDVDDDDELLSTEKLSEIDINANLSGSQADAMSKQINTFLIF